MQVSTPLEDVLAAMPEDAREVAREDLASIVRGERDTTVQRHRYDVRDGTRVDRDPPAGSPRR